MKFVFNLITLSLLLNLSPLATLISTCTYAAQPLPQIHKPEIIGGEEVDSSDPIAKTTVALINGDSLCSGSIIGDHLVVTAAHCVEGGTASRMRILAGLNAQKADATLKVASFVAHESYDPESSGKDENDIALVRFEGELPSGFHAAKLLPVARDLTDGQEVMLAGYGITNASSHDGAGVLRKVEVKIEEAAFAKTEVLLDQTHGRGACHGDSGGPAFATDGGKLLLWGITSRGYPDTAPDDCAHQAVYTNINGHRSWLRKAANQLDAH